MVRVRVWGSLRTATGGAAEVQVEAANIREMLDRLVEQYPGLGPQVARGVSVSVDGLVYRDAWLTPISPTSEVVLLPRLAGG